jgi:glycerophosphoryl diester phosphodiesterase
VTRTAWFDGAVPRVLAHRGWTGSGAVENTLDAFRAA